MRNTGLVAAVGLGGIIAYVDTRPTWDDAGITALAVFVLSALFGAIWPRHPWLWALAVGAWIPAAGILGSRNYGSLLALVVAFAGAHAGAAIRKGLPAARA